jgi:ABC-type multidrug transport system ATPase subunit
LKVAGVDVRRASASARQHLGYVAQKFSLYGQLTVGENLAFFARAYGLEGERQAERIAWALSQFMLEPFVRLPSAQLPGGFKQRLAMAASLLHRPEILFLDEPTSGADPFARREFWQRITALASGGVTVIVTTHFMAEAEYCDRAAILDNGRILAQGTPAELRARAPVEAGRTATMEDAFIAIVLEARGKQRASPPRGRHEGPGGKTAEDPGPDAQGDAPDHSRSEQHRDRDRLPPDVDPPLRVRALARHHPGLGRRGRRDVSSDSTALVGAFQLSPYFAVTTGPLDGRGGGARAGPESGWSPADPVRLHPALASWRCGTPDPGQRHGSQPGAHHAGLRPGAGRRVERGAGPAQAPRRPGCRRRPDVVQRGNDSHYFLVPGLIVLVMTIIGSFLTAMVIAREWERGRSRPSSSPPCAPGEFLLSKFIPYFGLGMIGFVLCLLAGKFLFHVPLRGPFSCSAWLR